VGNQKTLEALGVRVKDITWDDTIFTLKPRAPLGHSYIDFILPTEEFVKYLLDVLFACFS
jgi:hypothetical protein